MRKIKIFMVLFLLVAGVSGAWAQSSGDTYQKYVYKGVEASDAVGGSEDYYLYNVGTGTFFFIGSTWGTKGSLLYDDLGLSLSVFSTRVRTTSYSDLRTYYYFSPKNLNGNLGMVQITDASNTPGVYADRGTYSGSTDDDHKFRYNYLWALEPVTDAPTGVTQYYLRNLGCSGDATYDGHYRDHTSTAANFIYLYGSNQNLGEVQCSGSKVESSSFYKWQIVPESELITAFMNETSATAYGGLNASLSFLIQNQGFYCTNTGGWKKTSGLDFIDKDTRQNHPLGEQASVVGTADANGQMNFGKYYHANLSGTGWLYQTIDAPKAGLYHIYCQGFDSTGEGAVFYAVSGTATSTTIASIANKDFTSSENSRTNLKKTTLTRLTSVKLADYMRYNSSTGQWEPNPNNELTVRNLAAGVAFYNNEYTNDLYVYVPNDNGKITIAIQKKNSSSYTAVDDFHALYLGAYSFMIDEEDTRAKATGADGKITEWYHIGDVQQNASVLEEAKHENLKNISVMFKRSMTVGQWNTLVLPFDMSATAFKRAFGETTKLAECTGLDQTNPNVITFKQDDISSDAGVLIKKGNFYLIDPGNGPSELDHDITFIDTEGTERHIPAGTKFFTLGRQDFSGTSTDSRDWENADKKKIKTPESVLYKADNHNSIQLKGTYFRLDNFDEGDQRLSSDLENGESQKYVFGHKNDTYAMWRLGKTKRAIKGTRWWIEDVYSSSGSSGAKEMMLLSFNGVVDGDETLAIDMEEGFTPVVRMDNKVYNLNGQVVNATLESLPRGIYVVNGKKYVVK